MAAILFIFTLIFFGLVLLILGTFAWGGILAAPWVPLWKKEIRRLLRLAAVKPEEMVYDLGAGDGRIIILAAQEFGARSVGFEIAVLPFFLAYIRIWLLGLRSRVSLKFRNFYQQDLSQADVICVFLTPAAMAKLKPKLQTQTKSGCRIVSYAFKIPDWPPEKIDRPNEKTTPIYLYRR